MTFVTAGLAIAGLAAIAIPIIIHLLARQRRKPIEWAAMRFLLEAFRKHKRRLQLEQLVLLAVRCLILALLGLALARPILQGVGLINPGGNRSVYLVIDDGMVAGVQNAADQTALDRHVEQAVELVGNLAAGDTVGLVTAARPAKALLTPPSSDHAAVINILQSLSAKEAPTDLPGALALARGATDQARQSGRQPLVYLFSEFRGGSAAIDSPLPTGRPEQVGDAILLASAPAGEAVSNIQIVSIEPVRSLVVPGVSDGSGQITVRLRRRGDSFSAEVTKVTLVGEGLPALEPQIVHWQPGQSEANAEFMLRFGNFSERQVGLTAVIDDDSLNADNRRHTVLDLRSQIRVLLVDRRSFGFERTLDKLSAGQWIRRALEPLESSPIQIVEAEPAALDLADVRTADVVVLPRPDLLGEGGWRILRQFTQQDGLLIVMPPAEVNVHRWAEDMARELNLPWRPSLEVVEHQTELALAEDQPAAELMRLISNDLAELARPIIVRRVLPVEGDAESAERLLVFADGSPMIVVGAPQGVNGEPDNQSENPEIAKPQAAARGLVVYLAVAPEESWTNLPTQPLMVPLFQEMIRQGLSVISSSQRLTVGEQPSLALGPAARDLTGPDGSTVTLDQSGRPQRPFERGGVYAVLDESDQAVGKLAVNVDPAAGDTGAQNPAAVAAWLGNSGSWSTFDSRNIAASLGDQTIGSPVAGILLLIALALVIVETLLARWFSHADRMLEARDMSAFGGEYGASPKSRTAALIQTSGPRPQIS